ncbi:MAG: calcium-binding protein [Planctomycetota bacterium]|jgi:hypothetical protein
MKDARKRLDFEVGDSVMVKPGTTDPDLGIDIGGWQGRVTDITLDDDGTPLVEVEWDSVTLQNMPDRAIERCEEMGLGWTTIVLAANEVAPARTRDAQADVTRVVAELSGKFAWSYLGEQGTRIGKVLTGVDPSDTMAALHAWAAHLEEHLTFPFEAEIDEYQSRSPLQAGDRVRVTGIGLVDDLYGVIVDLRRGHRKYALQLCDLEVIDKRSPNDQLVGDYRVWFANR